MAVGKATTAGSFGQRFVATGQRVREAPVSGFARHRSAGSRGTGQSGSRGTRSEVHQVADAGYCCHCPGPARQDDQREAGQPERGGNPGPLGDDEGI